MDKLEEFLKVESARLSCGRSWLYWDDVQCLWVVMTQEYGHRVKKVSRSENLEQSLETLKGE